MDPINLSTNDQSVASGHHELEIEHDGRDATFPYHADELVGQLRDEAVGRFELDQAPSDFSLLSIDGIELDDELTLDQAGLASGTRLRLVLKAVMITCNARTEPFAFIPDDLVGKLRQTAVVRFGIAQNPHLYALFTEANHELPDDRTLRQAGVHPGELLVLRQSTVRGGSR